MYTWKAGSVSAIGTIALGLLLTAGAPGARAQVTTRPLSDFISSQTVGRERLAVDPLD